MGFFSDPVDDLFNPLSETASSISYPNPAQDNLSLPEIPMSLTDIDCVNLGPIPEFTYTVDEKDIASLFYIYKVKSEIISKQKKFQETDLHELLALTHVLLLTPWEYSPAMLKIFEHARLFVLTKQNLMKKMAIY